MVIVVRLYEPILLANLFFDDIKEIQTLTQLKQSFSHDINRGNIRDIYHFDNCIWIKFADNKMGDREWQHYIHNDYSVVVAVILEANV